MNTQQNGIVLVTALIFLFVLMLLGLGALTASQLQIRMSHNLADESQRFQAAEAGLREGEKQLPATTTCFISTPLQKIQGENPWLKQKNYCDFTFANINIHYLIEQLFKTSCVTNYRITAWTEVTDTSPIILQSTYAVANGTTCDPNETIRTGRLSWRELSE